MQQSQAALQVGVEKTAAPKSCCLMSTVMTVTTAESCVYGDTFSNSFQPCAGELWVLRCFFIFGHIE